MDNTREIYKNVSALLLDERITQVSLKENIEEGVDCFISVDNKRVGKSVEIIIKDVKKIDFYYDIDNIFYFVDRFKLIIETDQVYLSLDPFDDTMKAHDNDCCTIIGQKLIVVD